MSGEALLDTNAVIALFAGEPTVVEAVASKSAIFLCVPVVGELRYGALASARVEQNLARLDDFAQAIVVLPCDTNSARSYSAVKFNLRRKRRPIPENDVWIAAIARQHQLSLISRDMHFQEIDGLDLELV
jgi:tRNA(fMet)-specific endonuclease VapC